MVSAPLDVLKQYFGIFVEKRPVGRLQSLNVNPPSSSLQAQFHMCSVQPTRQTLLWSGIPCSRYLVQIQKNQRLRDFEAAELQTIYAEMVLASVQLQRVIRGRPNKALKLEGGWRGRDSRPPFAVVPHEDAPSGLTHHWKRAMCVTAQRPPCTKYHRAVDTPDRHGHTQHTRPLSHASTHGVRPSSAVEAYVTTLATRTRSLLIGLEESRGHACLLQAHAVPGHGVRVSRRLQGILCGMQYGCDLWSLFFQLFCSFRSLFLSFFVVTFARRSGRCDPGCLVLLRSETHDGHHDGFK